MERDLALIANSTELLSLTRRLVRFRSYTPGVARSTIDFIHGWFEARDMQATRYKGAGPHEDLISLVVRVGSGEPRILLHGHADVVPGEERQFDPYEETTRSSTVASHPKVFRSSTAYIMAARAPFIS